MSNDELKLEWLIRSISRSHHRCEFRQDGTPRTTVKCAGCGHSSESYEQYVKDILAHTEQRVREAKKEAYQEGLLTGAMPEAIGKPIAESYLATLSNKAREE